MAPHEDFGGQIPLYSIGTGMFGPLMSIYKVFIRAINGSKRFNKKDY